jgi:hypothetical protein
VPAASSVLVGGRAKRIVSGERRWQLAARLKQLAQRRGLIVTPSTTGEAQTRHRQRAHGTNSFVWDGAGEIYSRFC